MDYHTLHLVSHIITNIFSVQFFILLYKQVYHLIYSLCVFFNLLIEYNFFLYPIYWTTISKY